MSLLLDALHRASKEREKLAEQTAAASGAGPTVGKPGTSKPDSNGEAAGSSKLPTPLQYIPVSDNAPVPVARASAAQLQPGATPEASPYQVLDFESLSESIPTAPQPDAPLPLLETLTFSIEPTESLGRQIGPNETTASLQEILPYQTPGLQTDTSLTPSGPPLEIAYKTVPAAIPEAPVPIVEPKANRAATPLLPTESAKVESRPALKPEPAPEPAPEPDKPTALPPPQAPPTPPTATIDPLAARATPPAPDPAASPRMVSEILSATKSSTKTSKRAVRAKPGKRVIAMGIIAIIVAAGSGSLFLGVWDDLLGISNSQLGPIQNMPAPVPMPAEATPPVTDGSMPPKASTSEAAPTAANTNPTPGALSTVAASSALEAAKAIASGSPPPASNPLPVSPPPEPAVARPPPPALSAERPLFSKAAPSRRASEPKSTSNLAPVKPVFTTRTANRSALDQGYAALTEGRLDIANESYLKHLKTNPDERDALLGLAHIAQRQGRRDEARVYYQRVLRHEPDNPTANAGLLSMVTEGDLQSATGRARDIVERNPDSAAAFSAMGGILARDGRMADAQQAYFKALSLEPNEAIHAYNLAVALDRLHKSSQALGYYERALVLARKSGADVQDNFPLDAAMRRIEQLRQVGN